MHACRFVELKENLGKMFSREHHHSLHIPGSNVFLKVIC